MFKVISNSCKLIASEFNTADIVIAQLIMTSSLPLTWWLQQMVRDTNRAQSPGMCTQLLLIAIFFFFKSIMEPV